jgi:hypothetical protein
LRGLETGSRRLGSALAKRLELTSMAAAAHGRAVEGEEWCGRG